MISLATTDDAARVAAIYAPGVERTVASFEAIAPGAAEMAQRIASTLPLSAIQSRADWPALLASGDGHAR